jgi:hypothetical protein
MIMPNWCSNELIVVGKYNKLKEFVLNGIDDDNGSWCLSKYRPMPEELATTTKPSKLSDEEKTELVNKYGYSDWYDWNMANLGCKWDCSTDMSISEDDIRESTNSNSSISLYFESPWGPPDEWMRFITNEYPELEFVLDYEEPGMMFGGYIACSDGDFSQEEDEMEMRDEDGNPVTWSDELDCWVTEDGKEVEDVNPINPFRYL